MKPLTLYSRSLLEQRTILNSADANGIIKAMRDETSSLYCIADHESGMSKKSTVSETSAGFERTFDFDAEILGSRTYGVAVTVY